MDTARSLWARTQGLIGRRSLASGSALIIPKCKQVHTVFMRFAIDVIFLDRERKVVGLCSNLQPYRISGYYRSADCTVEIPEGTIEARGIRIGDVLRIGD